jgi:sugar diacid utilization regulator
MAKVATRSNAAVGPLPVALLAELETRRAGIARHMARAVVAVVHWDASTGMPPQREAIAKACEAGLDLFIAAARDARPATPEELRRVAQLGILQARSSQSVEPVLNAYRIAARVAWEAILRAWRSHPDVSPEALMVTANYVFTALDQVAAEVTKTYLHAREQHLHRGTRARARFFHSLVSDTFDSEMELQKQALALNVPIASGYVAAVCKLMVANREAEDGGEALAALAGSIDLPRGAIFHPTDPTTMVALWPAESPADASGAPGLVDRLQAAVSERSGGRRTRVRAGLGGYHPGLRGISRSYLEAQQALEVGRKLRPEGGVHSHDDLIPQLVLSQNPVLADRFVRQTLGQLLDSHTRGRDQLLETLEAFLSTGSVKEAAAALRLHRHTVLYRLDKLRDLLGSNIDNHAARLRLQLALDLRRLL